jgi:hypothetical protein
MALTLPCDTRQIISIDEYVEYVRGIALNDLDELAASAPMLRALANDRTLVVQRMNQEIEKSFRASYLPTAQAVFLGGGNDFYVRAAAWPSSAAVSGGRLYQENFAYHVAHDHNFTFLTVNYLGPGYETEIFEYDCEAIEGFPGEPVKLQFLEKKKFSQDSVMLYRASRDVHIQYPPAELSVTLNLMISTPELGSREQYYFDTARRVILDYAPDTDSSKSVSLMKLAGQLGDMNTRDLLLGLAAKHPTPRVRLHAHEALCLQQPDSAEKVWESACRDGAPLVINAARRKLTKLNAKK